MSVVTVLELKEYLQIDTSDTSQDTLFQTLINAKEAEIEQLGLQLTQTDFTETYDGDTIIFLKHFPIVSVSSLKVSGEALTEGEDFYVYDHYVKFAFKLTGDKVVDITYTAGFDTVPEDLKLAIKVYVAYLLNLNVAKKNQQDKSAERANEIVMKYLPVVI